MDVFSAIDKRRSVRTFRPLPIEEAKLGQLLNAINLAPSAGNLQAYEVVLVRDAARRMRLARASFGQDFVSQAPVCLVFLANPKRSATDYGERGKRLYCIQDATIAVSYAQLSATALGLATCWVGAFDDSGVLEAVEAKKTGLFPVAVLPIGYAAEDPPAAGRRELEDLLHEETIRSR